VDANHINPEDGGSIFLRNFVEMKTRRGVFYDGAFSQILQYLMSGRFVNNELERIWKEEVMAYLSNIPSFGS
jgi:hypothetical protein